MNPKLSCSNLSLFYQKKKILQDINLEFSSQGFYSLLGENGSGKSTFLKALLLDPWVKVEGDICLGGKTLSKDLVAANIAHMPQSLDTALPFRVLEVVMMGHKNYTRFLGRNRDIEQAAQEQLKFLNIQHFAYRNIQTLSGGERALVFLAKSLCKEVNILILDEPDSSLDYKNKRRLFEILSQLREEKLIIITSHDPYLVEKYGEYVIPVRRNTLETPLSASYLKEESLINNIYNLHS